MQRKMQKFGEKRSFLAKYLVVWRKTHTFAMSTIDKRVTLAFFL